MCDRLIPFIHETALFWRSFRVYSHAAKANTKATYHLDEFNVPFILIGGENQKQFQFLRVLPNGVNSPLLPRSH